ncbi:hypothetical protein AB0942_09850 [Streptomyces nodosus]|uniref:hypothetical protein n=1 Tax=Streptomyces nodosus TaxID=40318 RepID=UPI0034557A37
MLATSERIRVQHGQPEALLWHLMTDPEPCDGDCDFHAIACSDEEGITLPGPAREVPLDLDRPGQRWCPACLAAAQNIAHRERSSHQPAPASSARHDRSPAAKLPARGGCAS